MSERTILTGFHIAVEHEKQPVETQPGNGDSVEMIDIWTLVFTEMQPPTGDSYRISFQRDTRDQLVSLLTGGIVLAGGELPRL